MPAASVLFCDMVGFSSKAANHQRSLVNALTNEVVYVIREHLTYSSALPDALALPTGDGLALVLIHDDPDVWGIEKIMEIIFRLLEWADRETNRPSRQRGDVRLRIGLNEGTVDFFYDINGRVNVCGETINMAQRIMDSANPSQVLMSESFVARFFGKVPASLPIRREKEDVQISPRGPFEVTVKHRVRITLYRLSIDSPKFAYENADPESTLNLVISLTPKGKPIIGDFQRRLAAAKEVGLVQLTGSRLVKSIEDKAVAFDPNIEKLWVFMPSVESIQSGKYPNIGDVIRDLATNIEKWKTVLSDLRTQLRYADVHLGLFDEPPYFGASYLNWSKPGGRIHISAYVWGEAAVDCPGFDLEWSGREEPLVFATYTRSLRYLLSSSKLLI